MRHVRFEPRVEVISAGAVFRLTIGPVSLMLDRDVAEDVMSALVDALEPGDPRDEPALGSN
jgi:hypothetical protein